MARFKNFPHLKRNLIISFMTFHFFAMIFGALEMQLFANGPAPLSVLETVYGDWSGTFGGFKFFSPNVSTNLRVVFDVHHQNGKVEQTFLNEDGNTETHLRINSMISQFEVVDEEEEEETGNMHRNLAASWAGKLFAKYPDSKAVVVKVQSLNLPTMEQWRSGQRPTWDIYYQAKFHRKKET